VNKDGKVTSADALAVLKMAVGILDAPDLEWLFVPENSNFVDASTGETMIDKDNVTWASSGINANQAVSDKINFVGVLLGDVNGSWTPPNESTTLSEEYFNTLAQNGVGPLSQWEVVIA